MLVKKVIIDKADRLYQMPLDILSSLPSRHGKLLKRPDLIDLGSFNWPVTFASDLTVEPASLAPVGQEKVNQLKEELVGWFAAKHQVKLNSTKEIYVGGSISQLAFALSLANIDYGDLAFVPDLSVPLYRKVIIACGGEPVGYSVSIKNNWRPDFERVGTRLGKVARLLFLNSPHNPTGAELSEKDLANLIWLASRENILVANDAAYQSIPSRLPPSILAVEGAKRVAVEMYSFSYSFGLPHLPFGFAVGNREVIRGLEAACTLMPIHVPELWVDMAMQAIRQYPSEPLKAARAHLSQTSAEAAGLMNLLNLDVSGFATTPFLWARIQSRRNATTAARLLYRRSRVLVAPGTSFGENGQGFLRFSLTAEPHAYTEATARIKRRMSLLKEQEDQ